MDNFLDSNEEIKDLKDSFFLSSQLRKILSGVAKAVLMLAIVLVFQTLYMEVSILHNIVKYYNNSAATFDMSVIYTLKFNAFIYLFNSILSIVLIFLYRKIKKAVQDSSEEAVFNVLKVLKRYFNFVSFLILFYIFSELIFTVVVLPRLM
jgi:hypothetical protein